MATARRLSLASRRSSASTRERGPNWKPNDEDILIGVINRHFNSNVLRYSNGWWSIIGQTFNATARPLRSTEQIKGKWDRLKNLWRKPESDLSPAEMRIVNSRLYKNCVRKMNSSTDDNRNNQQSTVPSTPRRDPRIRATAQHSTNGESILSSDEAAQRLYQLKIEHMGLKIRKAELELNIVQIQHQQTVEQQIQHMES